MIVIVMGVASAGKTTVGAALARQLGWPFRDADSFHPPANVAKMSAGQPLTDADRGPWLDAIVAWMDERAKQGESGVATCSALKRAYRDRLRGSAAELVLVHVHGPRELLARRIAGRKDHFMPPSLLDSQLATLEMPEADERVVAMDIRMPPARIVSEVAALISEKGPAQAATQAAGRG